MEVLTSAKLDFLAEAFKRLCNGDDINVIVEEAVVAFTEDKPADEAEAAPAEEAPAEQSGEVSAEEKAAPEEKSAKGKKKTTK